MEINQKRKQDQKIIKEFYNNVFIAKNASTAINYLEEKYIKYNLKVKRKDAFINIFTRVSFKPCFQQEEKMLYVDGDYVIFHIISPYDLLTIQIMQQLISIGQTTIEKLLSIRMLFNQYQVILQVII